jgi:hypothetical protein
MPLTLRRRPRIPTADALIAHAAPTPQLPDVVPDQSPRERIRQETRSTPMIIPSQTDLEPEADIPETAPPTLRRRRRATRATSADTWRDRMLGEVFFFLLGMGTWLSNAIFTVLGVTAPIGLTLVTGVLGFAFHLLLSRAELYLWHRWRDPWYLLILLGCVLIDVGTTLAGLIPIAATWLPVLVGTAPQNVGDWATIGTALLANTPVPSWWPNAGSLLAIALAFALGSERLLQKFYRGMRETWLERPT